MERHTRYLPAHLREPLLLPAAMGRWTDEQYDSIRRDAGLLYFPVSAGADYRRLVGLSYVRPEIPSGRSGKVKLRDLRAKNGISRFRRRWPPACCCFWRSAASFSRAICGGRSMRSA